MLVSKKVHQLQLRMYLLHMKKLFRVDVKNYGFVLELDVHDSDLKLNDYALDQLKDACNAGEVNEHVGADLLSSLTAGLLDFDINDIVVGTPLPMGWSSLSIPIMGASSISDFWEDRQSDESRAKDERIVELERRVAELEGETYAQHILKTRPDAKIAVLYQNDDFGKDLLAGLKEGLGAELESKAQCSKNRVKPRVRRK